MKNRRKDAAGASTVLCQQTDTCTELLAHLSKIAHNQSLERTSTTQDHAAEADRIHIPLEGRRFGAYRLLAEIGGGGMGQVYRAVRADDEYRQEVAIKVVRAGIDSEFVAMRLRAERQILATLAHHNIARLLDGGTTEEGVPYIVMELVDGAPITRYCAARQLDVRARLELFLDVCSAVQYAHQRMVIHRDLKPSNILVTPEGTPKLLDFGIAKALEPGIIPLPADVTISTQRILTPEYASPEQMRGEPVTAASDVYSLGIILYELLTGARPYRSTDHLTRDVAKAVLEPALRKPSAAVRQRTGFSSHALSLPWRTRASGERASGSAIAEGSPEKLSRRLRGDLDNIVSMALTREPEQRYGTVEQLAEDIRRHLTHLPIAARAPTIRYRAARFVARHTLAVAATALVAAALVGGIVMTSREARIAEHQRALAEQRFDDVRRLAGTLIFQIHDSIRDLPGAERSRQLLISTALHYLDGLSRETSGNPSLQRQLAAAYLRLGDLQGRAREANEGDYAGALASFRRAQALLQAALAQAPRNPDVQRDLIVACGKLSDLMWARNDAAGALAYSRQTVTRSVALEAEAPANRDYRYFHAASLLDHGYKLFEIRGDLAGAAGEMRQSIRMLESLHASGPNDPRVVRTLTLGYSRLGELLAYRNDPAALSEYEQELRLIRALTRAAPHNADLAHLQAFAENDLADALAGMGHLDEAAQHYQTALASFRSLSASDPRIAEYHWDQGQVLSSLADLAGRRQDPHGAIMLLRQALAAMNATTAGAASDSNFRIVRAHAESLLGDQYAALASGAQRGRATQLEDWRTAKAWYEKALAGDRALSLAWFEARIGAEAIARKIRRCDDALSA
ncbi:MAG: protein kinase domain-containing protein [Steroidobacteraceae bacterium]